LEGGVIKVFIECKGLQWDNGWEIMAVDFGWSLSPE
jgi:hypothetical protein